MSKQWIDPSGATVPTRFVPAIDKKKTKTVERIVREAEKAQAQLRKVKSLLFEECDNIYDLMKADANIRTGKKGNYTISTFSKDKKIQVDVQESLTFDDNISFAKEKIEEYIAAKAQGVDEDLLKLVHLAFESRNGKLDTKRVLGLFKLKINHAKWNEAMELIKSSIDRNFSKRYARIFIRQENGEYKPLELNFSSL
jgi:hypothetical protein